MNQVNVYEVKTHLSRLLRRVRCGEEIVIAEAGTPVARLVPIRVEGPRSLGGDEGIWIADDFDASLPPDVIADFYGGAPVKPRKSGVTKKPSKRRTKRRP